MRFLAMFFSLLMVFGLALGGYLFGRDRVHLWMAANQLKRDFAAVAKMQITEEMIEVCSDKQLEDFEFSFEEDRMSDVVGFQLRFLDDANYVVELVCSSDKRESDFYRISTHTLPNNVKKVAGVGMLVEREAESLDAWVYIGKGSSTVKVGYVDNSLVTEWGGMDVVGDLGRTVAKATCEGYGYSCCDEVVAVGQGEVLTGTLNCPGMCYAQCQDRPAVLFFNTQPILDQAKREVRVPRSDPNVFFGYEIQDADSAEVRVMIDFGDGSEFSGSSKAQLSHTYNCSRQLCRYLVKLSAIDFEGNSLVDGERNYLHVVVY